MTSSPTNDSSGLIIGYSERDEEVVEKLIRPIATRWRVIRIGPTASGDGAIQLSAAQALSDLVRELHPSPEVPGWRYLTFVRQ